MSIASRKEKEFKAREELILKTSYEMIIDLGYIGFTIDKLAKKIDYAKGTIYKHFTCKEDIIAKLLFNILLQRNEIVQRALKLDLPTRTKFLVANIGVNLFNHLNPNMGKLVHISYVGSIWNKAQDKLREEHHKIFFQLFSGFKDLLEKAAENGEVDLSNHMLAEIFYTVASIGIGYTRLSSSLNDVAGQCDIKFRHAFEDEIDQKDVFRMFNKSIDTYLDGLGWQPLSASENYRETALENVKEVYADLVQQLNVDLF